MSNKKVNKRQNKNTKKKKKSSKSSKILIFLLLILTMLVVGITYKTKQNGGGMTGLLSALVGHNEETLKNLEPIQVLLMGLSTDNGGKLTDTIIIGTYNPKTQNASLLSIPRDTFVGKNPQTGTGSDKINSLYQKSPEKTLQKVNELTGLNIKYYMVIDNQALIELVDVIGGVEYDVPRDLIYTDTSQDLYINLKKGLQVLDGAKAEQLLRYRHGNNGETYSNEWGDNDMGRMRTQRTFIIETVKQTIQVKNILKIKDIIDIAYEYIETNLPISVIKDYAPYAINVNIDEIQSAVLPGGSYGPTTTPSYPYWFFIANKKETAKLIEQLYGTQDLNEAEDGSVVANSGTTADGGATDGNGATNNGTTNVDIENKEPITQIDKKEASDIKIEIFNGTGSKTVLADVKKLLEKEGYVVTSADTTTSTSKTTIINKTDVNSKFTDNIKGLLGVGNISTSSVSSRDVDITIIIGKDYK